MKRVLVTGGVRSGKSRYAESLLGDAEAVTYLAAGYPADHDVEWSARVAAHRLRRPAGWKTVEALDVARALRDSDTAVLIDCLGTWLTRTIDSWQGWEFTDADLAPRLERVTADLVAAIVDHEHDVVIVSNEVGWGVVPEHRAGRIFADHLGRINQQVGAACDDIVLMVAGRPLVL